MLQPKLLGELLNILNINHIDYMATGSIVSSLQGEPRTTHDLDIVVHLLPSAIPALVAAFTPPQYYLDENSIGDAIRNKSMFNLLDTTNGDKVNFWIIGLF